MRILNKIKFIKLLPIILMGFILLPVSKVFAVTPPDRGLGVADSYAVFGAAGVTNDGASTHIWGDVGANSSVTGLDDATQVDGTIKVAPTTNGVATDASSTYDSLMSPSQGTPATPTFDLAGTNTIGPGIYNVEASTLNGVLTLDGAGVYIFRSSSSNTIAVSGTMNLINGACASNVFWAISTSMTIGTGAHIEGTIIAQTGSITLGTNATLVGRAISLAQTVTLLSNQITKPVCAIPTLTSTSTSSNSDTTIAYCPPIVSTVVTPIIIESKRVDKDSVYITWGPYSGVDTFNVQYGFENGKWLFNTNVTGFSVTINDLPPNQPIWIRVAARNDCQIGVYGQPLFVGSPKLPNTGFAPQKNSLFVFINQIKNWFL